MSDTTHTDLDVLRLSERLDRLENQVDALVKAMGEMVSSINSIRAGLPRYVRSYSSVGGGHWEPPL